MASNPTKPTGALAEFTRRPLFHLSLPAVDLKATRLFYTDLMGATVEREQADLIEFNFFGGRLTAYRVAAIAAASAMMPSDGVTPLPNFGLIMGWEDWHRAVDHLNYIGVTYRVPPTLKRDASNRQQGSFALADPSGNCLSFSASKTSE